MEMLIFFALVLFCVWGRFGDRAAALLLQGLALLALSLLFGVLAGDVAATLVPPGLAACAVAAGLVMGWIERREGRERPPAS